MNISEAALKRIRETLYLSENENILALYNDIASASNVKIAKSGNKRCVYNGHILFIIDIPSNSIIRAQYMI